jgi:hypothetical protein
VRDLRLRAGPEHAAAEGESELKTARAWKEHYRREREELGEAGLRALVASAEAVALPPRGALVFPHTHLRSSGRLTATVARAVVASGCEEVLALGVLHGAREEDAALVAAARGGEPEARARLRRLHGPGEHASEEFSLDAFEALLAAAAAEAGVRAPRLHARFPFLVGETPQDLPGLDELRELRGRGAALVATADPIHHGAGYGTPAPLRVALEAASERARASIERGFELLARRDLAAFLAHAHEAKSDFRDPGPVLATLLEGELRVTVLDVDLADYAATLGADDPTWVAGALVCLEERRTP